MLDRAARLDILAQTAKGTLINIEVQVINQHNIDKRTLFYWAGLYYGQLASGEDFKQLKKTITINILGFGWFADKKKYHHVFQLREKETRALLNDDMEIHFLELPKIKKLDRRPGDALEEWLMYFNNLEGEEMEAIAMTNPGIKKALTIEEIFLKSKKERRIYELIEKARRDELSALAGARAEGEARGKAKGEVIGKAKGRAEGEAIGKAKGEAIGRQEAICKYLEARFGDEVQGLQKQVRQLNDLGKLDQIINKIYTASSLEEAGAVINDSKNS